MGGAAASTAVSPGKDTEGWGGKDDIVATARRGNGRWMYRGASSLLGSP